MKKGFILLASVCLLLLFAGAQQAEKKTALAYMKPKQPETKK